MEKARTDARIRELAEAAEMVFFLTDPGKTEMLYISPAYEKLWGRSRDSVYADARAWIEVVHPDDRERVIERLPRQAEGTWDEEFRLRLDDGTERWIRSRAYPIRDGDGQVVRVAGVATDITPLRSAQEFAVRSREELREILERIPVAVVVHQEGRLLYANRAALDYAGFERLEDLLGIDTFDLLHPDDRQRVMERMRRMNDTGVPEPPTELRIRRADGQWRSLLSVPARIVTFGGVPSQMLVMWDVSEQRRVEAALQESQERYATVFATSGMGIAIMDEGGRVVDANPAVRRQLGWADGEVIDATGLTHPEEREEAFRLWAALVDGSLESYDREARLRGADGEYVWCHLHVSGVRDGAGRFSAVSVIDDISEQKRLEEQLSLAQRIESIGRLAGGVAHDFNNIITVIQGHTDLLLEEAGDEEWALADLQQIRAAAERAAALTRQLLAFSRRQVLQPRVVDLNDVVRGMEPMLRRLIGEDVEVAFELADGLGAVTADPGQLEQVFLNMIVNARDAMPRGGRMTLGTHERAFDDAFVRDHLGARHGPHVGVTIRDTGQGMDRHTLKRIFEPFFTTKEQGKGTGLGLAMSYGIVKQSGGYIEVDSEPDEGTTFTVYFPREDKPLSLDSPGADLGPLRGDETILLVEDEPMVRDLARRALQARGYRVLTAEDGPTALTEAEYHHGPVDLLLTDVVMPRMGGREVAERLRQRRPGIRIVYMSGHTDDAVVRHGVLEESVSFLQKPFTPDELAAKVRETLDA